MELVPLLNSAVIAHYISMECWGTLPLGMSPLICLSSHAVNIWHFFVCMEVFYSLSWFQTKSGRHKKLAKIGWRRGAAMKESFVVAHANSLIVTIWYVKKTRKPEVTYWLQSRSAGICPSRLPVKISWIRKKLWVCCTERTFIWWWEYLSQPYFNSLKCGTTD